MQRALFTLTIFLNSSLLFLVQPLVARIILPVYGGSPAVWTASMVFFQAFLLLGYGYAHFTSTRLTPRVQAWLHVGLLIVAALTLPFGLPSWSGAVDSANPSISLLATLAVMVGATFFAISGGAPLVQRWFSKTDDKDAADPYFLYSASNVGSLLALLAYPFFLEPSMRLGEQARLWGFGYAALIALMVVCAGLLTRLRPKVAEEVVAEATPAPITNRQRALWIALAAVPSSLLLGVTTFLTTNIAPIPLLWVVPLSLYLLTYILAFSKRTIVSAKVLGRVAPLIAIPLVLMILLSSDRPLLPIGGFHVIAFFGLAWMCHARLNESRPSAQNLTEFYLWISVGGVVGGLFNGLIAPVIFSKVYEYPLAIVLAIMLRPRISMKPAPAWSKAIPPVALVATLVAIYVSGQMGMGAGPVRTLATMGAPLVAAMIVMDWPIISGLTVGAVILGSGLLRAATDPEFIVTKRSFFGVHTVARDSRDRFYRLVHGNTIHGMQDKQNPKRPLTYYYPNGPIGDVFKIYDGPLLRKNVALVGLGVGSLAAYGKPGQHMTYFEIDPEVLQIAKDEKLFTFLKDSQAKIDFVVGDARLTLAKAKNDSFDLIVLDAFSSDAIPIHLITIEAFEMYLSKLQKGGLIAVHISNRYLDLQPVLKAAARKLKLQSIMFEDGTLEEEAAQGKTQSVWVVLAREESDIAPLLTNRNWNELYDDPVPMPWTDDYSNVLGVFSQER